MEIPLDQYRRSHTAHCVHPEGSDCSVTVGSAEVYELSETDVQHLLSGKPLFLYTTDVTVILMKGSK